MRKSKKLPEFKTEAEERAFWESHDSSDCVDWSQAEQTSFPRQLSGHPPQKPGNSGSRAIGLGDCVRGAQTTPLVCMVLANRGNSPDVSTMSTQSQPGFLRIANEKLN